MNPLPIELIEQICSYLPAQSKCTGSLVSHSWHALMNPFLYSTVTLHTYESLEQFIRTITSSKQANELKALVRHVRILNLIRSQNTDARLFHATENLFNKIEAHFPNLQTMILNTSPYWSEPYAIKYNNIKDQLTTMNNAEYISYFSEHMPRFNKMKLLLKNQGYGFPTEIPQIRTLEILDQRPKHAMNVLPHILKANPKLGSLTLTSQRDGDSFFTNELEKCSTLRVLMLEMPQLKLNHVDIINATFTHLLQLNARVNDAAYDKATVYEFFKCRHNVNLSISGYSDQQLKETMHGYWALVDSFGNVFKRKLNVMESSGVTENELSLSRDSMSRSLNAATYSSAPALYRLFQDMGQYINDLCILEFNNIINLSKIHETFPNLVDLDLSNTSLDLSNNNLPISIPALQSLRIDHTYFNQQYMDILYAVYPNLRALTIYFSEVRNSNTHFAEEKTYNIRLPWGNIAEISLNDCTPVLSKLKVVVVRRRADGLFIMWEYKSLQYAGDGIQYTDITDSLVTEEYINSLEKPLLIINSTSIQEAMCDE